MGVPRAIGAKTNLMQEPIQPRAEDLLQVGFRYAYSLTHHYQDAEDLVQTAWLKLHQQYGHIASKSILFTTIRRLFIDQYRRRKIMKFEPFSSGLEQSLAVDDGDDGDLSTDLHRILFRLRDIEREALFLNVVEGHSASEIARMTGKPRGTVLSLIQRARQKLAAFFKSDNGSAEQA